MIFNLLGAEIYKSIRLRMLWLALLLPALIPVFTIFSFLDSDAATFRLNMQREHEKNAFYYLSIITLILFGFLLPFISAMVVISLNYMEKQANGWKYLFISAFSDRQIMITKGIISAMFILAAICMFFLAHMTFGYLFSFLRPDLNARPVPADYLYFFLIYLKAWVAVLGLLPVLWLISLVSRSYIVISVFASLFGMLIPGNILPFKLAGESILSIAKSRKTLNLHSITPDLAHVIKPGLNDVVSLLWLIAGFALLIFFLRPLIRKLI